MNPPPTLLQSSPSLPPPPPTYKGSVAAFPPRRGFRKVSGPSFDLASPGSRRRRRLGFRHLFAQSSRSTENAVLTLREFPIEKLSGEVAVVRFDSSLLLKTSDEFALERALSTIRYLYNAGAKILLVGSWVQCADRGVLSTESFADYLSELLCLKVVPSNVVSGPMQFKAGEVEKSDIVLLENLMKFKEELANSVDFSRKLSCGAYVFVNDAFSLSHRILASTVGICGYCDASVAGFHFEEELLQLTKTREITGKPYISILGGSKFLEKVPALRVLASVCDHLIFVGKLAFQIMHALGKSVPSCFLEQDPAGEALKLIQFAWSRGVSIHYPNDLWCVNNQNDALTEIFPSDGVMSGWKPVDLGPASVEAISSSVLKCKKVLWIGRSNLLSSVPDADGESKLALVLERMSNTGCEVYVVGSAPCKAISKHSSPLSQYKTFQSASVVWEFLMGKILPGVSALDRAYPIRHNWSTVFRDPALPLIIDIGSGNGLFLLKMAKRLKKSNFLGLEMNDKLVARCQQSVIESGLDNIFFISTNATSSFRSIVSSYPGILALTAIQCPNPDFNREEHRWRMVRRLLVEAIVDLLVANGKIFLQSDIQDVALRMKEQFMMYGEQNLVVDGGDNNGWLSENPFEVRSDWEQHVLDRGGVMYRVMLRKVSNPKETIGNQPSRSVSSAIGVHFKYPLKHGPRNFWTNNYTCDYVA